MPPPESDSAGFVLAGGRSSRMGTEKALVELDGRPLIAHAVRILESAGLRTVVAGAQAQSRSRLEEYASVLADVEPGSGPLGGIVTAMKTLPAEWSVFLPVDMPLLPSSLIECLLRRARITGEAITTASVNAVPQTFPAVVARAVFPVLEREFRAGRLGCLAAFEAAARELAGELRPVPAEVLAQTGQVIHPKAVPVVRWFLNVNTDQDLRRAESVLGTRVS